MSIYAKAPVNYVREIAEQTWSHFHKPYQYNEPEDGGCVDMEEWCVNRRESCTQHFGFKIRGWRVYGERGR